ncbi:MAG: HEAT repeat domain-containing protein [Myxococcales bacterium]|nr:HEAT repeat domain-containing protein [Myxococcales bacterium]
MYPVGLWATAALAQSPSPARLCADAAEGTEIEVCLRVAIAHPQAVDEVNAALVAQMDRAGAPDRELLEGVLLLSGPEGSTGCAQLAELGDPRAIPVLLDAARHRPMNVAVSAVTALAAWPEVWPTLGAMMVDEGLPEAVRIAAAEALAETGDPRAAAVVESALQRPGVPRSVHRTAAASLADRFPGRAPPRRTNTSEAAFWLSAGAGVGLGYAMAAVGTLGPDELLPVAIVTGGAGGVSLGWVYGRAWPMDPGEGALITVSGLGAGGAGALLGAAATPGSLDGPLLGGLGGEILGFTTATLLRTTYPGTARDVVEGTAFAMLATLTTDGLVSATAGPDAPVRPLADGLALSAGLGAGLLAAPLLEVGREDVGLIATGTAVGLGAAMLLPARGAPRRHLVVAGPAAGAAVGLMLADPLDLRADVWMAALTGAGSGAAVGGGIGLLLRDDPGLGNALALTAGAAGLGVGAAFGSTDDAPVDDRDVVLVATTSTWVAAQAAVVSLADGEGISRREVGGILLATGLVSGATASLNLELDVPVPHVLAASSVGLWGAYAGAAIGQLAWERPEVAGLVGTNVGLAAGGLLVSDLVGTPAIVISMADAGGVVGASLSGLVASAVTNEPDVILGTSLAGAVGGAIVGGTLGRGWHRSGGRRDIAFAPRIRLPGRWSVLPSHNGVRVVVDQW